MIRWGLVTGVLAVLLACSSPEEIAAEVSEAQGESAAETLERRTAAGFAPVAFADEETRGEAARDFAYNWPAQVSAIAPLAAILETTRDGELAKQKAEWEASVAEFGDMGCITCINRSYAKSWEVVTDTPRFLVLSAETYTYTGGAHGNSQFDALLWDREEEKAMKPVELFVDPVALENTAFGDYCQALLEAKREKLSVDISEMNPFDGCPGVGELVVIVTASDGEHFDSITFLAAPYVAGSYAEGPYVFSIPMTDALLEAVKPEYCEEFALAQ